MFENFNNHISKHLNTISEIRDKYILLANLEK